jgi:hypothetical protein
MLSPFVTRGNASPQPHKYDDYLRQVAESDTFRAAPVMRALLVYLWKNQTQPISEYAIATEALGRSAGFDPKSDSTVRVQVARLRAKLKEFYEAAGESFPLRLSVPLGGHELQWTYRTPEKTFASKFNGVHRSYLWAAGITGIMLVTLCIGLMVDVHLLKASLPAAQAPLPRFWQSFLLAGKPAEIVVPNPLYFSWPSHHVYVRDLQISDFTLWPASPLLKETAVKWGPPELAQQYVGGMELRAGLEILQFLEKEGQQVRLTESRRFAAESFAAQNTIFLGMPRTAVYLNQMLEKTNYYIADVDPVIVRSRNPQPGEPPEYRETAYSADRRTAPAIIVLLPTRPEHTRTLLLLGRHLTTMSSMLVTREGLKLIDEQWMKAGSPDAWEMVVQADINRDTILRFYALTCRPIPASFWK